MVLNPIARPIPRAHMDRREAWRLLDRTWRLYPQYLAAVDSPIRPRAGPALVLRLTACTTALHDAIVEQGETHERAHRDRDGERRGGAVALGRQGGLARSKSPTC